MTHSEGGRPQKSFTCCLTFNCLQFTQATHTQTPRLTLTLRFRLRLWFRRGLRLRFRVNRRQELTNQLPHKSFASHSAPHMDGWEGREGRRDGGSWVVLCTCLDMLMRSLSSAIITTNAAAFPTHLVTFCRAWEKGMHTDISGKTSLSGEEERMKERRKKAAHFKANRKVKQNKQRN